METTDILTMILFGLIVAACWVATPGLIAGWLLRESGWSFKWGFLLGAVCGPLGVLLALTFVFLADRRAARFYSSRHRAARVHYNVPAIGRLHASTAWTLAGLAIFMCLWALGGISYELFYRHQNEEQHRAAGNKRKAAAPSNEIPDNSQALNSALTDAQTAATVKRDGEMSPRPSMIGALTAQPAPANQLTAGAAPSSAQPEQTASLEGVTLTGVAPTPQPTAPLSANMAAAQGNVAAAAPSKPAGPSRAAIISELTSALGARGFKAHATVSGDARTSTLSISCATLTRAAGNQLLGNGRTRESLKAAGIRIVVMINGEESWSYML